MKGIEKLECKLITDKQFLGKFLVDPKETMENEGISLGNISDVKRAESFLRNAQTQIKAAAELSGFQSSNKADWGIGFFCCNSLSLMSFEEISSAEK